MYQDYNIYFLEYTHKGELGANQYSAFGKAIFWGGYKNAFDLLEQIKPKFVIFYFIESYNHVALNVCCKHTGVKTFHMEHGIRNYEMLQENIASIDIYKKQTLIGFIKKLKEFKSRINGRLFFRRTISKLPVKYNLFLKKYYQIRSKNTVFDTFRKINSNLRIADCYISFSPKVFEFHQKSDHLPEDYPVHFIGCPSFDYLANNSNISLDGSNILFIDNAFESEKMFGWHDENKIRFLSELLKFVESKKSTLWIKPHPRSRDFIYENVRNSKNAFIINQEKDFVRAINDSKVVLGFYSTLLMPLMAMKHTVCFSLEMHPSVLEKKPSMFLVETGAINIVNSWEELGRAFEQLDDIFRKQTDFKKSFIEEWMYKFDGKSSERLKSILLSEAS